MANHTFAIVPGAVTNEKIRVALDEIVKKRFKGLVEYIFETDECFILFHGEDRHYGLVRFWLRSQRTIEFRGPYHGFAGFVQHVTRDALAKKFKGKIGYDFESERHKPTPNVTFKQFMVNQIHPYPGQPSGDQMVASYPEELRNL